MFSLENYCLYHTAVAQCHNIEELFLLHGVWCRIILSCNSEFINAQVKHETQSCNLKPFCATHQIIFLFRLLEKQMIDKIEYCTKE